MKKHIALSLLLFVLLSLYIQAEIKKGPYLIYPGDNSRMTILWQVDQTETGYLAWGTDANYSGGSAQTTEYGKDHQHKHTITGLTPGTKYYYRVKISNKKYTGSFRAAPQDSVKDIKFLVYGDTRTYPDDHNKVCNQMVNTYTNDPAYQTLVCLSGDYVGNGDDESHWQDQYFDRNQPGALEFQANMPVMGCLGNHERTGDLFKKYFPYPFVEGKRYYSFDYGPAHIIFIDQYESYSPGSDQYNWLVKDLETTTKPWKILVLHEPGWTAGAHKNNTAVQEHIQPLCLKYGIKVVLAGHNHYYARCEVDGIQHITAGGGGAPLYNVDLNSPNLVTAIKDFHFCEVHIQGDRIYLTTKDTKGRVIDSFDMDNSLPAPPPSIAIQKLKVQRIFMRYKKSGSQYYGLASIWITDHKGANVVGAEVFGTWSGSVTGDAQGTTDKHGRLLLKSPQIKKGKTFTFTITDIKKPGYTYKPNPKK